MKISTCIRPSIPAALAALTLFAAHASAQSTGQSAPAQPTTQPAAQPTAPSSAPANSMPVSLPVTVVDKKGDPVKGLAPSDLTLTDNGHIQTIQSFAAAQPAPVTFGILGQTSSGLRTELGDERLASVHFVDHTLPGTDDKFFVVQFANEVDLLEDPTSTVNKLHDALTQMGSPQFGSGSQSSGGDSSDQTSGQHQGGSEGGTLYDAIYLASTEVLKKQPGQHVLVLVTDGIDRNSKETINDAIEAAQAAHAAIFAIYYKGEEERTSNTNPGQNRRGGIGGYPGGYPGGGGGYPGGGGGGRRGGSQAPSEGPHVDGKEILEQICNATGGYMVEGKKDKADEAYGKVTALLKNQYTLSYTPDKDASESVSHHLSLTSKKGDIWTLVQQDYSTAQ
jgi:VWFA-related protein